MDKKNIKVLHIIDGLSGGGSQEWVKTIVASVDRNKIQSAVCYLFESPKGVFSYGKEIKDLGADVFCLSGKTQSIFDRQEKIKKTKDVFKRKFPKFIVAFLKSIRKATIKIANNLDTVTFSLRLHRYIKKNNVGIIHSHMFHSFLISVIAGKLSGVPMVYTVPALKVQCDHPQPWGWIFPQYKRYGKFVSLFFTSYPEELIKFANIPVEKIKPLTSGMGGVDVNKVYIKREDNPVIGEFSLEGAFPILLSVGRFTHEKGHIYSIDALKIVKDRFPKVKLFILGEGSELEKMRALVKENNLSDFAVLPGFRRDIENFYSLADVFLRTYIYETNNAAACYAALFGLPIVAFDTKAPTEFIRDEENGVLIPNRNSEFLANAIINLASDTELREKLKRNIKKFAESNLNIKKMISSFELTYLDLADKN